jgi:drug/metabolite transporter (DMT)-like permease
MLGRVRQADHPLAGLAAAAAAVMVWGVSSVLIKEVDGMSGLGISFHRLWVGAAFTTATFMLAGGRISWRLLRRSAPGGVAFALDILLFFTAVQHTTVANATVIGALQPVLVLALAPRLFGEHPRLSDAFWAAVAIAGAVLVVFGGANGGAAGRRGDLLAVGALVAWTWYFVASKQARRELDSYEYLAGLSLVALVVSTPIVLLTGTRLAVPETADWLIIVAIALVNGLLGHFLMNWAHAHVPLVAVSLMTLAIPVFATAGAAIVLHESVSPTSVVGMAIVIGALAVVVLHTSRVGSPAMQESTT